MKTLEERFEDYAKQTGCDCCQTHLEEARMSFWAGASVCFDYHQEIAACESEDKMRHFMLKLRDELRDWALNKLREILAKKGSRVAVIHAPKDPHAN